MNEIELNASITSNKIEDAKEESYFYAAEDDSFLDPFMQKNILSPLLKNVIPWELPANIITITGNTSMLIAFIIAMLSFTKNNYKLWFLIPFLIIFYMVNDCLDGGQARKTKTGSPLGEFLDHFLDTFVTAELIIPILLCYRISNIYLIFFVLFLSYLTQAISFWERYSLGHMHFSKFGSTETIITLTTIITLGYFSKFIEFLQFKIGDFPFIPESFFLANVTLAECGLIGLVIGAITSLISNLKRTNGASLKFWAFTLISFILAIAFAICNNNFHYLNYFIFCLYSIDYICALLVSIVDKKKDPIPDFIFPIFILLSLIFSWNNIYILVAQIAYPGIKILVRSIKFIYNHRQFWVWKNPAKQ